MRSRFGRHAAEKLLALRIPRTCCQARNKATRCLPCSTLSAQVLASTRPPTWTSIWVDVSHAPHRADVWSPRPVGGMGCPVGWGLESAQKGNPATPRASVNMGDSLVAGSERLGPVDGRGRGGVEHGPDDLAAVGGGQDPERAGEASDDGEPSPVQVRS